MWHEARRQEKKIRVMMVDRKRRADRRRQFYESAKQDPAQFVRVNGRPYKIHWEHSVAFAAEAPQTMMPWQGDNEIQIDRFDVRSHLDHYVEPKPDEELSELEQDEERKCNYERYRILVQNDVAGVTELQCLRQIHIDEMYGAIETANTRKAEEDKKKTAFKKAAIGFTYEDSTTPQKTVEKEKEEEEEDDESDLDEVDLDNTIDIYNLTLDEIALLNEGSAMYGMEGNDFYDNMELDKDEAEALRVAKLVEEEKAQFSGRKSRRERRAFKEKRLKDRPSSPPAYAARESPTYEPFKKGRSTSRSKSRSPDRPEQFAFITSFGSDAEEVVQGPTLPPHLLPKGVRHKMSMTRKKSRSRSRDRGGHLSTTATARIGRLKALRGRASKSPSKSRSRSPVKKRDRNDRSTSRSRRSRSRGRMSLCRRSRSRGHRSRSRSRSRWSRSRSRGRRSRSRSRGRRSRSRSKGRRSRSRSRGRRSRSRSRGQGSRSKWSRSRSYDRKNSRNSQGQQSHSRRSRSASSSQSRSRSSSYSRSRSRSRSGSSSRSSSRSPLKIIEPVIRSYRRPSLSSNSGLSSDSDKDRRETTSSRTDRYSQKGNKALYSNKGAMGTAADKMKLRMQKALKRQLKADQRAQQEKDEKVNKQRQNREDELRAMAIQMRRRERERRHKEEAEHVRRSRSRSRHRSRSKSSPHSKPQEDNGRRRSHDHEVQRSDDREESRRSQRDEQRSRDKDRIRDRDRDPKRSTDSHRSQEKMESPRTRPKLVDY